MDGNYYAIGLGNTVTSNVDGIFWTGTFKGKNSPPGDFEICQLINVYDAWQTMNGVSSPYLFSSSPPELDNQFPYGNYVDTPYVSFPTALQAGFNFSAITYLMWESPNGGIYVPLATITWGFSITGEGAKCAGAVGTTSCGSTVYGVNTEPQWSSVFSNT